MKRVILLIILAISLFSCTSAPVGRRILFIGDSITDGNWGQVYNSERNLWDLNHIYGHGYVFLCVSEMMSGYPSDSLVCFNRGISGNTISDMRARWQSDALDLHPDVVSILIGINDVFSLALKGSVDTAAYESDFRDVIDRTLAQNPAVRIVICEPFVFPVGDRKKDWDFWYSNCRKLAVSARKIAEEYNLTFIPYQKMFDSLLSENPEPSYWIWDGVHPTAAGHYRMAKLWLSMTE